MLASVSALLSRLMNGLVWSRARRRRKVVAAALGFSVFFVVINVALAIGQWDPSRQEFQPGSGVEVSLTSGDRRIVYLSELDSIGFASDFYPSDYSCSASGPTGDVALLPVRHRRLLNVWAGHDSVAALNAPSDGAYVVTCAHRGQFDSGREATLVLARPARLMVGWASPQLALFVLMMVVIIGGATWLIAAVVGRARGRRPEKVAAGT